MLTTDLMGLGLKIFFWSAFLWVAVDLDFIGGAILAITAFDICIKNIQYLLFLHICG